MNNSCKYKSTFGIVNCFAEKRQRIVLKKQKFVNNDIKNENKESKVESFCNSNSHDKCKNIDTSVILDCIKPKNKEKKEHFGGATQYTHVYNRLYDSYPFGWHAKSNNPDFSVCKTNPYVSSEFIKENGDKIGKHAKKNYKNKNTLEHFTEYPYPIPQAEHIQCKDYYTNFRQNGDTFISNFKKPYLEYFSDSHTGSILTLFPVLVIILFLLYRCKR